ncbi:MAG: hypothetical protein D3906_07305 [Candidatus Electrothrix sp. AUS1_2]|nr:hypothetical protein [Candidatus Electrothrix sp. AUS1_2]
MKKVAIILAWIMFFMVTGSDASPFDDQKINLTPPPPNQYIWRSYTYDPRQSSNQPGEVSPHDTYQTAGNFFVYYGPSGKNGLDLPPASIKKAGPFKVEMGKNYTCVFRKPDSVSFQEGASPMYSVYPDSATIYVRNEMTTDVFLGVYIGP